MTYSYSIIDKHDKAEMRLLDQLQRNFSILREEKQQGIYHYFDTFDWRLYRQGYHLYLLDQILYLYHFPSKKIEIEEDFHSPLNEILLFQGGRIFKKIERIIDIRALLCIANIHTVCQSFRILNRDNKTIARICILQSKMKDKTRYKNLSSILEIKPLRGYANQVPGILKRLPPAEIVVCKDDLLQRALSTIGRKPVEYTSKLNIHLTKQMSAIEATKQIYITLLEMIRKNEDGIIKDIDIEFLHDFRVAIRRTRSALGQIKGILDENVVFKAKEYFTFLGRSTNKLRDIDIYLLREKQYKMMVPMELRKYLNSFFKSLENQRKVEHQSLVKLIKSAKYKHMLSYWDSFLKSEETVNPRDSESVQDLARRIIRKRNKKVLDFGQKVLSTGSDELLHELRIEGKKLRYLLEFFHSLFAPEKIQYLIKKLKLLQDNLGDLNDLLIQQERLIDSAREISPRNRGNKNIVLTLGILIGKLNEKQLIIKKEFAKLFLNYAAPEVQKNYDELFQMNKRRVR